MMDSNCHEVPDNWKLHHENDFQWGYRKMFIKKNLKNFSDRKTQLNSLSMTWANVTFLGCRYPLALMEKIAAMSEGIEITFKPHPRETPRLPRNETVTEVATIQKTGFMNSHTRLDVEKPATETHPADTHSIQSELLQYFKKRNAPEQIDGTSIGKKCKLSSGYEYHADHGTSENNFVDPLPACPPSENQNVNSNVQHTMGNCSTNGHDGLKLQEILRILGDFVVINHPHNSSFSNVCASAKFNSVKLDVIFPEESAWMYRCVIYINGVVIGRGASIQKKEAQRLAGVKAFQVLQAHFPVITKTTLRGEEFQSDCVRLNEIGGKSVTAPAIPNSNIGHKLLQKIGWTGGGLGKEEHGRTEPVQAEQRGFRTGLGLDSIEYQDEEGRIITDHINDKTVKMLLRQVATQEREYLVFSSSLGKEQRARIHTMSTRMGLRSQSFGKGKSRYLTIRCRMEKSGMLKSALSGSKLFSIQNPIKE